MVERHVRAECLPANWDSRVVHVGLANNLQRRPYEHGYKLLFIPARERNEESIPTTRFLSPFEMTGNRVCDPALEATDLQPDRRTSW